MAYKIIIKKLIDIKQATSSFEWIKISMQKKKKKKGSIFLTIIHISSSKISILWCIWFDVNQIPSIKWNAGENEFP